MRKIVGLLILTVLFSSFASAGFLDWLLGGNEGLSDVTGMQTAETNASVDTNVSTAPTEETSAETSPDESTSTSEPPVVVNTTTGSCAESDRENNPRIAGLLKTYNPATGQVNKLDDVCASTSVVAQYGCNTTNPLTPFKKLTPCPNGTGCVSGACLTPAQANALAHQQGGVLTRGAQISTTAQSRTKGTAVGRGGIPRLAGLDLGSRSVLSAGRPLQSGATKLSVVSSEAGRVVLKLESTMQVSNNDIFWFDEDAFGVKVAADGSVSLEGVTTTTTTTTSGSRCDCVGGGGYPCACQPPQCGSCSVGGVTSKTGVSTQTQLDVGAKTGAERTSAAAVPVPLSRATTSTGSLFSKLTSIFR